MMARVRSVMASSTRAASRFPVSGSTSTKTGVAPASMIELAVAMKVIGVVMTSQPGPTPSASREMCSAPVQLVTATQWRAPR
jgi:hypothetical protein